MKKEFLVGVVLVILLSSFVVAQGNVGSNITEGLKNLSVAGSGARDKTNEMLAKEIEIPENLQFFARVVFGLKADEKAEFQTFIILICLWVIVLILVKNILEITPFFGEGWKSWVLGLTITVLIALSGAIREISLFFFGFGKVFGVLEKWGLLNLLFILIVLGVLFYGTHRFIRLIKGKTQLIEAAQTGDDIRQVKEIAKAERGSMS